MVPKLALLAVLLVLGVVDRTFADEPERIVGGDNARVGEFPYQVSLRLNGRHFCGGSIISNIHILTAAHCLNNIVQAPYNDFTIVSGSISTARDGVTHRVRSVIMHPNFIHDMAHSLVNDIAVVTLTAPIAQNAYQKPIAIATTDPPAGASVLLSGWGNLETRGPQATILQKAVLQAINNNDCQAVNQKYRIYPTQLCTRSRIGVGACQGDSGGPLVYNNQLVGIVSWVYPCAMGKPDVFTRPSQFLPFINDAMRRG